MTDDMDSRIDTLISAYAAIADKAKREGRTFEAAEASTTLWALKQARNARTSLRTIAALAYDWDGGDWLREVAREGLEETK